MRNLAYSYSVCLGCIVIALVSEICHLIHLVTNGTGLEAQPCTGGMKVFTTVEKDAQVQRA